jgi:agmatine deiminase
VIHKIHQPGPLFATEEEGQGIDDIEGVAPRPPGRRLPGSYINFYLANRGVIMPLFDDPHDQIVQREIQNLFPEREVVGVPGREILLGGGNIHCITQQQPDGMY